MADTDWRCASLYFHELTVQSQMCEVLSFLVMLILRVYPQKKKNLSMCAKIILWCSLVNKDHNIFILIDTILIPQGTCFTCSMINIRSI